MMNLALQQVAIGWALAINKVKMQTKEHIIGYGWAILTPVIYAVCFIFVKQGITGGQFANDQAHWMDVLRAFMGISLIQLWFQLLREISDLVRRRRSLLRGMTISEKPLILAVIFESSIGLFIRVILIALAVLILHLSLPGTIAGWAWCILCLCTLLFSATAIGLILAPWAALYPDVGEGIRSITMPMIMISPVFYPATNQVDTALFWLNCLNPMAPVIATLVDILESKKPFYEYALIIWFSLSVILAIWASRKLKKQIPILLERLGS